MCSCRYLSKCKFDRMFATSLKSEENLRKTPFQVLVVAGLWVGSKGPTSLQRFASKK
jgi:hypothetical protein